MYLPGNPILDTIFCISVLFCIIYFIVGYIYLQIKKRKMKDLTWQEYYQLPLKHDGFGSYAFAKNNTMTLMFETGISEKNCNRIVDAINGIKNDLKSKFYKDGIDFYIMKKDIKLPIFCIRGWGGLIGIGGHNLSSEKAAKIQDEFADYVLNQLNKKQK